MNRYAAMKRRHQKEVNDLPLGFAFSTEQFNKMMEGWGLDPKEDLDKLYKLDFGGFYQKKDAELIRSTFKRHNEEAEAAIAEDTTGEGFIYEMWLVELDNHEYSYTMDCEEALDALGYTVDEVMENPALKRGLEKAVEEIMGRDEW